MLRRRAAGNGSLRVSSADLAGKVTRYSSEFFLDWFVGTHAPCKEHTIVTLAQPQPFVGTFGAEPDGPGRTGFGVVSGSLSALFSHRVVRHPLTYSKHGLFRYGADEAWTLIFTRCPGTSPC